MPLENDESFSSQRHLLNGAAGVPHEAREFPEFIAVEIGEDHISKVEDPTKVDQDDVAGKIEDQNGILSQPEGGDQRQGRPWSIPMFLGNIGTRYTALTSNSAKVLSPSATFRRVTAARDMVSMQTPDSVGACGVRADTLRACGVKARSFRACGVGACASGGESEDGENHSGGMRLREGVSLPAVGEIRWKTMKVYAVDWLRDPKNLALLAWILAVAVSGAILFMVMTGMLNAAIPSKGERDAWFEVNNQILNALFTLMCLYLHPQRFLHAYQLIRWNREDVLALRKIYCKHGTRKPHEWMHMVVVVVLLHMNCLWQYALCGLNWGYKRSERPAIGVGVCLAFAIGSAAGAGIYNTLSPLGRDYVEMEDEEMALPVSTNVGLGFRVPPGKRWSFFERRPSFASRDGKQVEQPQWQGGLFDCCDDPEVALLSAGCGFCVFGWNMDRLGFGNRFVHIATFLLICSAPYWIFLLAAGNIDNKHVRQGLGLSGIVLSVFGLMYGGFWRIRMRTTFGLPASTWCCGQPNVTDCAQWMFCSLCSLCQEVRTTGHYDIKDDKFYLKSEPPASGSDSASAERLSPLGRERAFQAPGLQTMDPSL